MLDVCLSPPQPALCWALRTKESKQPEFLFKKQAWGSRAAWGSQTQLRLEDLWSARELGFNRLHTFFLHDAQKALGVNSVEKWVSMVHEIGLHGKLDFKGRRFLFLSWWDLGIYQLHLIGNMQRRIWGTCLWHPRVYQIIPSSTTAVPNISQEKISGKNHSKI